MYLEADQVVTSIENTKNQYLKVLDTVNEREQSILLLESHVNKLLKENETMKKKYDQN